MGAVTGILFASKRCDNIAGLVLDSPFSDLKKVMQEIASTKTQIPSLVIEIALGMIKSKIQEALSGLDIFDSRIVEKIKKINCPVLFAYAKSDNIILPYHTETLHQACPSVNKYLITFEGNHNTIRPTHFFHRVSQFINENCHLRSDQLIRQLIGSSKNVSYPQNSMEQSITHHTAVQGFVHPPQCQDNFDKQRNDSSQPNHEHPVSDQQGKSFSQNWNINLKNMFVQEHLVGQQNVQPLLEQKNTSNKIENQQPQKGISIFQSKNKDTGLSKQDQQNIPLSNYTQQEYKQVTYSGNQQTNPHCSEIYFSKTSNTMNPRFSHNDTSLFNTHSGTREGISLSQPCQQGTFDNTQTIQRKSSSTVTPNQQQQQQKPARKKIFQNEFEFTGRSRQNQTNRNVDLNIIQKQPTAQRMAHGIIEPTQKNSEDVSSRDRIICYQSQFLAQTSEKKSNNYPSKQDDKNVSSQIKEEASKRLINSEHLTQQKPFSHVQITRITRNTSKNQQEQDQQEQEEEELKINDITLKDNPHYFSPKQEIFRQNNNKMTLRTQPFKMANGHELKQNSLGQISLQNINQPTVSSQNIYNSLQTNLPPDTSQTQSKTGYLNVSGQIQSQLNNQVRTHQNPNISSNLNGNETNQNRKNSLPVNAFVEHQQNNMRNYSVDQLIRSPHSPTKNPLVNMRLQSQPNQNLISQSENEAKNIYPLYLQEQRRDSNSFQHKNQQFQHSQQPSTKQQIIDNQITYLQEERTDNLNLKLHKYSSLHSDALKNTSQNIVQDRLMQHLESNNRKIKETTLNQLLQPIQIALSTHQPSNQFPGYKTNSQKTDSKKITSQSTYMESKSIGLEAVASNNLTNRGQILPNSSRLQNSNPKQYNELQPFMIAQNILKPTLRQKVFDVTQYNTRTSHQEKNHINTNVQPPQYQQPKSPSLYQQVLTDLQNKNPIVCKSGEFHSKTSPSSIRNAKNSNQFPNFDYKIT